MSLGLAKAQKENLTQHKLKFAFTDASNDNSICAKSKASLMSVSQSVLSVLYVPLPRTQFCFCSTSRLMGLWSAVIKLIACA